MKRIKINKNKSIGSVIYIVEGKVTEQNLIKKIFNQLLDYELYQINGQEKLLRLKSKTNKFSKVAVITSKKPQISTLIKQEDFFDNIYHYLSLSVEDYQEFLNKISCPEILALYTWILNREEKNKFINNGFEVYDIPGVLHQQDYIIKLHRKKQ